MTDTPLDDASAAYRLGNDVVRRLRLPGPPLGRAAADADRQPGFLRVTIRLGHLAAGGHPACARRPGPRPHGHQRPPATVVGSHRARRRGRESPGVAGTVPAGRAPAVARTRTAESRPPCPGPRHLESRRNRRRPHHNRGEGAPDRRGLRGRPDADADRSTQALRRSGQAPAPARDPRPAGRPRPPRRTSQRRGGHRSHPTPPQRRQPLLSPPAQRPRCRPRSHRRSRLRHLPTRRDRRRHRHRGPRLPKGRRSRPPHRSPGRRPGPSPPPVPRPRPLPPPRRVPRPVPVPPMSGGARRCRRPRGSRYARSPRSRTAARRRCNARTPSRAPR